MNFSNKIQTALQDPRPFSLLHFISRTFEITNRNAGQFVLGTFIYYIFFTLLYLGIVILTSLIARGLFAGMLQEGDENLEQMVMMGTVLAGFIGLLLWGFIVPASAGYAHVAHKSDRQEEILLNDFFVPYRSGKWSALLMTSAVQGAIYLLFMLPGLYMYYKKVMLILGMANNPEDIQAFLMDIAGSLFLLTVPYVILRALFSWGYLITWFSTEKGWPALDLARRLLNWNFLWIILFDILLWLTVMLGMVFTMGLAGVVFGTGALYVLLLIIVMLFLTLYLVPWYYNFKYITFADSIGLDEEDPNEQEDRIIDHFMPDNNEI